MSMTPHLRRPAPAAAALAAIALLAPPAAAQVQVGGQIRLTVNRIETGSTSTVHELRDNASRLSFRGTEDMGGGLHALFGVEFGFGADDGVLTSPAFRYSYVGLSGRAGALALGRLDSANPTGSPLYSQVTAITTFAPNDAGATAIGTSMLNSRNRTSNSIGYRSPSFGGVEVMARATFRGAGSATEAEDDAKSYDLGLLYRGEQVIAGVGYAKDTRSGGLRNNELDDKWQAGVRLRFGTVNPYLLVGVDRYRNTATSRREVAWGIAGVDLRLGQHGVVVNLLQRDVQGSRSGERRRVQAAYTYALSKRTELQAFADSDGIDSSRSGVRVRAVGAGVKHLF
jgi:predicted porin